MFNAKALVAKSLTVLGKLLIPVVINTSAMAYENTRFFDYRSNTPVGQLVELSFGWFKKLNDNQKDAYYQSIAHAVMYAENGQKVDWYRENASGFTVPVVTWPTGSGYCRRIYLEVIAYNTVRHNRLNACYNNSSDSWSWTPDK